MTQDARRAALPVGCAPCIALDFVAADDTAQCIFCRGHFCALHQLAHPCKRDLFDRIRLPPSTGDKR